MDLTVYDTARELANQMLESEFGKAVNDARYIFDGNEEAQKLLFEYTDFKQKLETGIQDGSIEDEDIEKQASKLDELAKGLRENSIINDMMQAENRFQMYVNSVMNVFNATLSGNENGGCTGSCSTCGGCH